MAQIAANIAAASPKVGGGVYAAPKGTALPTDTATVLNVAMESLGYVSEDGLQPAGDGASYNDVKAWGGDIVTSVLESKSTAKWSFTLLEVFSGAVNEFIFGEANVTVTAATISTGTAITVLDKGDEIPRRAFVFDMRFGGKLRRFVLPDAQVAVTGEGPLTDSEVSSYECEVTAYPDAAGVRCYRYLLNDDLTT